MDRDLKISVGGWTGMLKISDEEMDRDLKILVGGWKGIERSQLEDGHWTGI